ncbi:MAG: hypothetical protein K6T83_07090 [Alicyclobacillus sp.]|nr:hypothetical protein [Alicyclobacillus sp.]
MKKIALRTICPLIVGSMLFLAGCGVNSNSSDPNSVSGVTAQSGSGWTNGTNRTGYPGRGRHFGSGGFAMQSQFASVLNISTTTLNADLKKGMSILDIAKKKGMTEQQLIAAFEKQFTARMNQHQWNGNASAAERKNMQSRMKQMVVSIIEHKGPMTPPTRGSSGNWPHGNGAYGGNGSGGSGD